MTRRSTLKEIRKIEEDHRGLGLLLIFPWFFWVIFLLYVEHMVVSSPLFVILAFFPLVIILLFGLWPESGSEKGTGEWD
jgi:ABC-type proline/glycine betaine transport system permease subunit